MHKLLCILVLGLGVLCTQPQIAQAEIERTTPATWPRALELMAAGQVKAALPLLERLVSDHPDDKNYRFELAVALYRLEKDFRAKWQLEQIRGARLTPAEAQMVDTFMAQIASRSRWSGSFHFAIKPESNASQKTDVETVNIGGFDFTLNPDARAEPSVSLQFAGGLRYTPKLSEKWDAVFSVSTNLRHNKRVSLRDYQLFARAGLQFAPDARSSIAAGVQQGYRWIGDTRYSRTSGLWADYARLIGARGRLDFGANLGWTQHDVALPDSRSALFSTSYSHAIKSNARLTVSGYYERNSGNLPNLSGTRKGLSISGLYAWRGGLMTSIELGQHYDNRNGPEPLFGLTRKDTKTALSVTIYHRDLRLGSFAPTLIMGVEKNRSSIPLARYDNSFLSVGLTRNF